MTPDLEPAAEGPPTAAEIAAFTTRWRHVSSRAATEQERADWLADKAALLVRLERGEIDEDDYRQLKHRSVLCAPTSSVTVGRAR